MRRHLLTGRFGSQDNVNVPAASDEFTTQLPLIIARRSFNYGIQRALDDLNLLNIFPSEIGVDLIILATHVYAADTRISRSSESQDTWTREIRLVVPVSNPMLWISTSSLLSRILNFLTGDKWTIGFRPRLTDFSTTVATRPNGLIDHVFDRISLFSGGLDSLIGAIDVLESGNVPLLVSHAGEGATSNAQRNCFDALKNYYTNRGFEHFRAWINFPKSLIRGVEREDTTRGRSFLFFALGIFAGSGLNQPFILRAPENGLIALNVPLDIVRLGSLSTRTMHPFYIARWNELLSKLGIDGNIENPYWNKTKGEMISSCSNQSLLRQIIRHTLSCSSPTKGRWHGRGPEHCGYCLPCLIRRAAIESVFGHGNDPTTYTVRSLSAQTLNTLRSEGKQVRSFQLAIQRLQQQPDLAKILIHKSGSLADQAGNLDVLAGVYQRGMNEVARFLSGVQTRPY